MILVQLAKQILILFNVGCIKVYFFFLLIGTRCTLDVFLYGSVLYIVIIPSTAHFYNNNSLAIPKVCPFLLNNIAHAIRNQYSQENVPASSACRPSSKQIWF
ncbi:hypothetical protein XENTR_v10009451 [Xenopus tropicalis]|nr:hypothetical protein XENTR_v10009451 [Xenopus tropicalis]